jgi:hypothetical protein
MHELIGVLCGGFFGYWSELDALPTELDITDTLYSRFPSLVSYFLAEMTLRSILSNLAGDDF